MSTIRVLNPHGTMPAVKPRQLADNVGQSAINLRLGNNEARPLDGPSTVVTPYHGSDTLAIHRYPDVSGALGTPAATSAAVGSNIRHNALSPDGKWMAVALTSSPYIAVYAVADAALTAPTSPTGGDIPAGQGHWVAWSPDGRYVFLGHDTTPFVSAWPWDGTWGTLATPGTPPASAGLCVAVSPDGEYVAVAHATTPYLSVYLFTDDFGTQVVPTGKDIPAGAGAGVTWSLGSRWVLLAHATTPYVSAWRWTGALGDKRTPGSSMLADGNATHIAVAPDNRWVAIVQTGSPYTRVWRFDTAQNDPFRYLVTDPGTALSSQAQAVSWDSRGGFLFYGVGSSPFLEAYAWGYGAFGRKLTATAAAAARGLAFSSDDSYVYISYASTTGLAASDRSSTSWFNWNRRVNCVLGPVANDYRNRRYFTGDGPPKKTGNDLAIPGSGSPPLLPADWLHMGVKAPAAPTADNEGDPLVNAVPAGNGFGIAWSPDGRYLAVAHEISPYITVWDMEDPDNPVKFADPATIPTGAGQSIAWSPDGAFVGVGHTSYP
ncbi:MAG TPA: hypothetical protein VJ957_01805, partial [Longimicrobiales bacterium]|nr:hypothetical protein [Longimicrobiales bacterium]